VRSSRSIQSRMIISFSKPISPRNAEEITRLAAACGHSAHPEYVRPRDPVHEKSRERSRELRRPGRIARLACFVGQDR